MRATLRENIYATHARLGETEIRLPGRAWVRHYTKSLRRAGYDYPSMRRSALVRCGGDIVDSDDGDSRGKGSQPYQSETDCVIDMTGEQTFAF